MINTNELYEYNEKVQTGEIESTGKPQWFKLWVDKYVSALDIEHLDEDLTQEEKYELFAEVGKAFINALFYFTEFEEKGQSYYPPKGRDGRILMNALKMDINQAWQDYYKRVEDGKKGGRPRKEQ